MHGLILIISLVFEIEVSGENSIFSEILFISKTLNEGENSFMLIWVQVELTMK